MSVGLDFLKGFQYRSKKTLVHTLDPRSKAVFVFTCTIITLMFYDPVPIIMVFLATLLVTIIARVVREWLATLRGAMMISLIIFILNFVTVSESRLNYSLTMCLRFITLTSAFSILFLTTNPDDISLAALKLGIPYEYTLMFTMAMRFVPTLARDAQTIMDAQRSRGLELEKGNFIERLRRMLPILIPLVIYEIRRSMLIAEALESRAFGSVRKRTNLYDISMTVNDWILTILSLLLLTFLLSLHVLNLLPKWFYWKIPDPF